MLDIRFPRDRQLPNRVVRSPRLLSFIPAEELDPLVAAYSAAQRAAKDAAAVKFEADDITEGVRASIQKGEDIDAAALVRRLAQQAALRDAHRNAVAFFQTLPNGPRDDLAGLIMDYRPELYAGLGEHLDSVLDRATKAVADLDGAHDAEAAMDANKAREFSAFRALVAEHASIRGDYIQILNADGDHPFNAGDPRFALALFGGIVDVYPDILPPGPDAPRLAGWQHTRPEPFPIYEYADREHLLYVVQHRAPLKPHIVTAAEATTALKAAKAAKADAEASDQPQAPGGELTQWHGGERGVLRRQFGA
jgi:hypothetical protein